MRRGGPGPRACSERRSSLPRRLFGPLIGGATFLALLVAGQMIAALAIDHYGVLGFPVRPVDGWRIAGALLVVAGVVPAGAPLVRRDLARRRGRGCCCVMQWMLPPPSRISRDGHADDLAAREQARDRSFRAPVRARIEQRHHDMAIGDVEIHVGSPPAGRRRGAAGCRAPARCRRLPLPSCTADLVVVTCVFSVIYHELSRIVRSTS